MPFGVRDERRAKPVQVRPSVGRARAAQGSADARRAEQMEIHVVPMLLGAGERLFENLDGGPAGFESVELVSSPAVAHPMSDRWESVGAGSM